jgi:PAS domain S-box-containing protein
MNSGFEWSDDFDAMSDAVCFLDQHHVIRHCNKAMKALFGSSETDLIGRCCWEVVHGIENNYPDCPVCTMERSLCKESQDLYIDGRWFHVTVDPFLDETGKLNGILHYLREIVSPQPMTTQIKGRRVLVMDDEEFIRDTITGMLDIAGVETICVNDGREALIRIEQERENGRNFDAIICDLTVPGGFGGKEIVLTIRQTDPRIPIIVSSGYSDDPIMADPHNFGFSASIAKPFTLKELHSLLNSLFEKQ